MIKYCEKCESLNIKADAFKNGLCKKCYKERVETNSSLRPLKDLYYTMMGKCYKPEWTLYKHYGALGYTVCPEWHDKHTFFEWAKANGYSKGKFVVFKDPRCKEYSPSNCIVSSRYTRRPNIK